ncbi:6-O-methylguanine DNA methyltransferase, partial [Delphinella strobiligena]
RGKGKREVALGEGEGGGEAGEERGRGCKVAKKTEERRKIETMSISKYFLPSLKNAGKSSSSPRLITPSDPDSIKREQGKEQKEQPTSAPAPHPQNQLSSSPSSPSSPDPDPDPLHLISTSKLNPFRKLVLSHLCAVPRGNWTTYAAISDHISSTSHKTCARAVGNAMRKNPFAPLVPCHRVLASGGAIGGFWGWVGGGGGVCGGEEETAAGGGGAV